MCEESRLLQVSGLGGWALINEREYRGRLGVGWEDGQLCFRLVDFVVGMGYI